MSDIKFPNNTITWLKAKVRENPICGICSKGIIDGMVEFMDCQHIRHSEYPLSNGSCELCELNDWNVM